MKTRGAGVSVIAAVAAVLAACAADPAERDRETRQVVTPVVGAAAGLTGADFIGGRAAEMGLGTVGFIAGLALLPYLEERDYRYRDAAIDRIVDGKPGDTVQWSNPHTEHTGELTFIAVNEEHTPETCRDLQSKVFSQAKITTETMLVCRLDSGWYIRDSAVVDQKPTG